MSSSWWKMLSLEEVQYWVAAGSVYISISKGNGIRPGNWHVREHYGMRPVGQP